MAPKLYYDITRLNRFVQITSTAHHGEFDNDCILFLVITFAE